MTTEITRFVYISLNNPELRRCAFDHTRLTLTTKITSLTAFMKRLLREKQSRWFNVWSRGVKILVHAAVHSE